MRQSFHLDGGYLNSHRRRQTFNPAAFVPGDDTASSWKCSIETMSELHGSFNTWTRADRRACSRGQLQLLSDIITFECKIRFQVTSNKCPVDLDRLSNVRESAVARGTRQLFVIQCQMDRNKSKLIDQQMHSFVCGRREGVSRVASSAA